MEKIRSAKSGKYKSIQLSPLRYAGGKSKAVGLILENLPKLNRKKIISPFFGGGSVELCLAQELEFEVVGYDTFDFLVNFWNVLMKDKEKFISELMKFEITKEEFYYNREVLLHHWEKVRPDSVKTKTRKKVKIKQEDLVLLDNNSLLQAVYYYYNMSLSYGPMFIGWPSSTELNKAKFERRIEKLKSLDFKNITISCNDFKEVLKNHSEDFLFLDPPYYLESDSKVFKGIYPNPNFAIHHNKFDHIGLHDALKKHKGGFLLTYNNCAIIREWYKNFPEIVFQFPKWQYTYGQGEIRIGSNRAGAVRQSPAFQASSVVLTHSAVAEWGRAVRDAGLGGFTSPVVS